MYPSPQNAARSLTHSHPLPVLSRTACSPLPHTYLPPPTPGAVARRAASTADSCAPCTATDHPLSRCRHSPSQLLRSPAVPLTAPPPLPRSPCARTCRFAEPMVPPRNKRHDDHHRLVKWCWWQLRPRTTRQAAVRACTAQGQCCTACPCERAARSRTTHRPRGLRPRSQT